jgi:FtsP/CotA-like multicopper oxidase with cupredoxin domain
MLRRPNISASTLFHPEVTMKVRRNGVVGRREVLKLGAAGMTAAISSGTASASVTPQQGSPAPNPFALPTPPPADSLVNPASLANETWSEAWIWRPAEWPNRLLDLNVVAIDRAGTAAAPGQLFPPQFSFGGISPAPTVRMRGDDVLRVRVRNLLGVNHGTMAIGPCPDAIDITPGMMLEYQRRVALAAGAPAPEKPDPAFNPFAHLAEFYKMVGVRVVDGHCMTEPSNTQHASRVTNLHTHGLHVQPNANPGKDTQSDNVFLRVISRDDWAMRQQSAGCALGPDERVGEAEYEFILGDVLRRLRRPGQPPMPQPPGTHWYHPHAHGSTHDQVSSGMAGFLILEGDVDEAMNTALTGTARPHPQEKTGPFDYRERLLFIQRVLVASADINTGPNRRERFLPAPVPEPGIPAPGVMFMRPGAVERWRILNASVDGRGFKRFMVLEGEFVLKAGALWRAVGGTNPDDPRRLVHATAADVDRAKRTIYQLAADGLTLVRVTDGKARHVIKDLSQQNAGTEDPLARPIAEGGHPFVGHLKNVEECFRDGDSIRRAFLRPNEIYLATANRADVFFKAPLDAAGRVYTVLAQEVLLHSDNYQQRLQVGIARGNQTSFGPGNPAPTDVVVAHVHVRGKAVEGGDFDVMSLVDKLPPVPPFLQPIQDDELRVDAREARERNVSPGTYRTRIISYSGYGGADFPSMPAPDAFTAAHPELRRLTWAEHDGTNVMLPPIVRTMAVNSQFELGVTPEPPPPRKFTADDPYRPKALVESAEEWVLYNCSITLWSHTDRQRFPQPGSYGAHYRAYPISRAEGQRRFAADPEFRITSKGADHPFHIHINPCWVTRIEVPDEHGNLHNILDEPRWLDTVWIPRNVGRVVFRTRMADFVGRWIHHCHILLHEDHGMMQEVETIARAADTNYVAGARVAGQGMTSEEVSAVYPRPSLEVAYKQTLSFVDPNPTTGQVFPGFELEVPRLT